MTAISSGSELLYQSGSHIESRRELHFHVLPGVRQLFTIRVR